MVKGMGLKDIRALPDRIVFGLPLVWVLTGICSVLTLFMAHNIILAGIVGFIGLIASFVYILWVHSHWKRKISYREYQESRMGR